jgi:serine-type D-Ala-D-Ala endopeptidase (penicillin-binding protein 7)
MQQQQRTLHSLEKIVVVFALILVLALSVGFAQAGGPKRKAVSGDAGEEIALRSAVAFVQDANTGEVVYGKNEDAVLPIASITKLMTAIVILERGLDLGQRIVVSGDDIDTLKGTRSRLRTGSVLTRDQLLLLSLMSSENRAAAALGRTYPGGTARFVRAMNAKAASLGMTDTRFVEPTGLAPGNVSSARDLAKLVRAAHDYPLIRAYSTRDQATVKSYGRALAYRNSNGLVHNAAWDIGLSKTGYIREAGRSLVMRVQLASKDLIVVLLDSSGRQSRIGDANRIRQWLEISTSVEHPG